MYVGYYPNHGKSKSPITEIEMEKIMEHDMEAGLNPKP